MKTTLERGSLKLGATSVTTLGNIESGSNMAAEVAAAAPAKARSRRLASWSGRWSSLGSDHVKRWEKRLYTPKSGGVELGKLAVRIQYLGQRKEFRFNTTNRAAAAKRALDVFRFLNANGWDATLAKYNPDGVVKIGTTIGDYLTAVHALNKLRPRTLACYQNALRLIAAEVFGIEPDKGTSKFNYRGGDKSGNALWTARIDAHRLEEFTPDKITIWKRQRVMLAGNSPAAIASTRRSVNSYIRCARSLFAPGVLKEIKGFALPAILPFTGVELEESGSQKYVSKIDAHGIIESARAELRPVDLKPCDTEAYKAFLLALFVGLRKAEIDLLEWKMLDYTANVIRLQQTEWLHLKTHESAAELKVDAEVLAELRLLQPSPSATPAPWPQFILASTRPPRPESKRPYYRAKYTFKRLYGWLRGKGVSVNKPLHELRKELGALIVTEHGIYAASNFLRHTDISTTARHYAAQKAPISVGLGKLLGTASQDIVAANS